jgi:undecaprenyl-diphosphatase
MYGGLLAYLFSSLKTRVFPFAVAVASSLASLGISWFGNIIHFRPRPFLEIATAYTLIHVSGLSRSFPSGHSSAAFGLAFGLYFWNRRWGTAALAAATLVALGRVYVGVHYPSDIIAGAALGFIAALVLHRSAHFLFKKNIKEIIV